MTKSKEAATTERKLTAAQVEENCPASLQDLGKRIAAHVEKARKCEEKCDQHYRSIGQLLAEVRQVCDDGGFETFRARYCPHLGQSRAYELLAIATDKKSIGDIRASTRARVAKHRAKTADVSVTVTEKSGPEAEGAPTEVAPADAPSTVPKQTAGLPKPAVNGKSPTVRDIALTEFTDHVCRLLQVTKKREPKRFIGTGVEPDALHKLGVFLSDIAKLKSAPTQQSTEELSSEDSAEASAEARKRLYAEAEEGA